MSTPSSVTSTTNTMTSTAAACETTATTTMSAGTIVASEAYHTHYTFYYNTTTTCTTNTTTSSVMAVTTGKTSGTPTQCNFYNCAAATRSILPTSNCTTTTIPASVTNSVIITSLSVFSCFSFYCGAASSSC